MNEDLLETLLRAALAEGALDADSLPRFAEALRARAALILADRVLPIAERAGAFETESTWRAEVMAAFADEKRIWEDEKRTWHEAHDRLLTDREGQVAEVLALKEAHDRLLADREAQVAEVLALKEAHDRLLAEVLGLERAHDRLLTDREAQVAEVLALKEAHDRLLADREAQVAEVLALKQEREALLDQNSRLTKQRRHGMEEVDELHAQADVDRRTHRSEVESRDHDIEFRDHEIEALKAEMEAARREKDIASAVHDRLLAHHRATLALVADALRGVSRDLPWRYRRARAALLELLRLLDKDTP